MMKKKRISLLMAAVLSASFLTTPALASEDVIIEELAVSDEAEMDEEGEDGTETDALGTESETDTSVASSEEDMSADVLAVSETEADAELTEEVKTSKETDQTLSAEDIAIVSIEEIEEESSIAVVSTGSSTVLYSGTCGDTLTWQLDDAGVLTISGSGAMPDYYDTDYSTTTDSAPWYSYRNSVKSVTVENGVTSIGAEAFLWCDNLASVSLPSTLTSIGEGAFTGCSRLTGITIPEGVTVIADSTFGHCTSLNSVTLPSTLQTIGWYAFDTCTSLTSITIPSSVTSIDSEAFTVCRNLQEILVESGSQAYCSVGGVLFTKDMISLVRYPSAKSDRSYTVPSGVTTIEDGAFNYCTSIAILTLSDSVTTIGDNVFYDCTGLSQITLSSNLTSMGGCAFSGCTALTSVSLSESLTDISMGAFIACTGLTSVSIPESVTVINWSAFEGCSALTDVYYAGSSEAWSLITIGDDNEELTDATIHYGKKTLSESSCTVTLSATSYTYDGNAKKPTVMVVYESNTLKQGTDYTVSYADNTNVGTAAVTITGMGGYEGTITKTFTINKAFQTVSAKAAASSIAAGKTTTITASGQGTITYSSSDIAVATVDSKGIVTAKKPGTVIITVNAEGNENYNSASMMLTIKVALAAGEISSLTNISSGVKVKWSKVTGASGYYIYRKTGSGSYKKVKTITKASTTSWTDTSIKSKNGTKYTYKVVPYSGNMKGSGTAKTTVRLSGVTLSSAKSASSKKLTVKWKKNSKASGYQIQYSTSSTFAKGNKTIKISGSSKISKTISKLTKNKMYYVRIRAYKTVSGKTYYSAWSSVKKAKVK